MNATECKDLKEIEKEIFKFYSTLYESIYEFYWNIDASLFEQIKELTPQPLKGYVKLLDFRSNKLDAAISKMSLNKSPGNRQTHNRFLPTFLG